MINRAARSEDYDHSSIHHYDVLIDTLCRRVFVLRQTLSKRTVGCPLSFFSPVI